MLRQAQSVVITAESLLPLCHSYFQRGSQELWLEPAPNTHCHAVPEASVAAALGNVSLPRLKPRFWPWLTLKLSYLNVPWTRKGVGGQGSLPHRRQAVPLLDFLSKPPRHRGHFSIMEAASLPFCSVRVPGNMSLMKFSGRDARET